MCTTSLKRAHIEYLKTLGGGGETRCTQYIYMYTINIVYIYIMFCDMCNVMYGNVMQCNVMQCKYLYTYIYQLYIYKYHSRRLDIPLVVA